ncbi:putative Na+/Ca+ antiporter (plasmid) [Alkalihalophilus pseudofirmus OF4]|uniref:Na+/Ca+ antiporter n=1 Tax=Alkalihalophilus pseudofirmus (strain ATCC BAA-2126 / JCM 17055 / OF4) TaxID=398511 RepID=D3G1U1_ALKPO|nr:MULTISPECIES: calcium/sodium antiporter [Alkalihalophilus]ADC52317.1 putative Na+/Ca+ antiporter [Alkalihalophilus pseudofirmus OF4]MED1603323.1 calcium/sodium antiporter [Alkalihalophilus marmarensis]
MSYILLLIGFMLLIKGADFFVDGASSMARALHVSPLLIGLTIVAFGTSSPEATVSIVAALQENAGVAIGNVVGSNIFNITFVVGIAAFITPLKVESETIRKEIPFTLLASISLLILISDVTLQTVSQNLITRSDGLIFLLFFAIFLYYIFEVARNSREKGKQDNTESEIVSWKKNIVLTIGGLAAIIFGGDLVVNNATTIAYSFGMSETLVGLTIVAVGTSLPELITSITAALKKESEIALGNIVGSNIFNILFVLGAASVISPLAVESKIYIDVILMIVLTGVLLVFSRTNFKIGKIEGIVLVLAYVLYMTYIFIRN